MLTLFFLEPRTQKAQGAGGDPEVSTGWCHMPLPALSWPAWSLLTWYLPGRQQDPRGKARAPQTTVRHPGLGSC